MQERRQTMAFLGLLLIALLSGLACAVEEEVELLYAAASPLLPEDESSPQGEPLLPSDDAPTTTTSKSDEDILVESIVNLIKSVSPSEEETARGARQMTGFGGGAATGRIRSLFNIPFGHGQAGFIPRSPLGGGAFYGAANPLGWQQRFMNTFSNLFSFGRPNQMLPYGGIAQGAASSHQPAFVPYPMANPYGNRFGGDLSPAASWHQNRFYLPQHPPQQYGPDLATSGSYMSAGLHHHHPHFQYAAAVPPKHRPLFQNVEGLKAASIEMGNAFADFADEHEHGPEVTQKFGSVGHTLNTFLGMMGLGPGGGITDDPGAAGGFGGGGDSVYSTPISRSSDFYPGYGNQAVMEEMEDYPIFQEDITKAYLTRMNLTHLLDHVSVYEKDQSDENGEVHVLEITAKDPETGKDMNAQYIVDTANLYARPSEEALYHYVKDPTYATDDQPQPATSKSKPVETPEKSEGGETDKESQPKTVPTISVEKKPWLLDLKKKSAEESPKESSEKTKEVEVPPSVSYKVPQSSSPVSHQDRVPPVATFQGGFAPMDPPEYAPAHALPPHDTTLDDHDGLILDNVVRSWGSSEKKVNGKE